MRQALQVVCAATLLQAAAVSCHAAALRVSPILVDAGPSANTAITLTNSEARPINAQVRVFRWSQHDGEEQLVPAEDVVASPPIVSIAPHEDYVVRLQRTGPEPASEDAYRVVVDELPNPNRQRNGTVAVVLRYMVPAFFFSPDASQPRVKWSIAQRGGRPVVVAENAGDKRLRLNDLAIKAGGHTTVVARGLAGYVLGHGSKEWPLSPKLGAVKSGTVVAMSDTGPISAPLAR